MLFYKHYQSLLLSTVTHLIFKKSVPLSIKARYLSLTILFWIINIFFLSHQILPTIMVMVLHLSSIQTRRHVKIYVWHRPARFTISFGLEIRKSCKNQFSQLSEMFLFAKNGDFSHVLRRSINNLDFWREFKLFTDFLGNLYLHSTCLHQNK